LELSMGGLAGLTQAAAFAGNSGKNSGFRENGWVRRSSSRQSYRNFKWLTTNVAAGGTAEKIAGTADLER
jgi:hypothetical protein